MLKIIMWNKEITPQLWIAPRGLITVLLFYTIPVHYNIGEFDQGILLYAILITSLVMTFALIKVHQPLHQLSFHNLLQSHRQ